MLPSTFFGLYIAKTLGLFTRVSLIVVPTLLIMLFLMDTGALTWISNQASPMTALLGLPSSASMVIVSGIPSMMIGIATAGPLALSGGLTAPEAVRTLLMTALLHNLYNEFRVSLPLNISFFGFKLGFTVIIVDIFLDISAISALLMLIRYGSRLVF